MTIYDFFQKNCCLSISLAVLTSLVSPLYHFGDLVSSGKGLFENRMPKNLSFLSLALCNLDDWDFLKTLPTSLTHLDISGVGVNTLVSIACTFSHCFQQELPSRLTNLQRLNLATCSNGIGVNSSLSFPSVTVVNLRGWDKQGIATASLVFPQAKQILSSENRRLQQVRGLSFPDSLLL